MSPTLPRVHSHPALPVSRNPWAYMAPGSKLTTELTPPPSNFSDCRLRLAENGVLRPQTSVKSLRVPEPYPMRLIGVAPQDAVPVVEVGTRPRSAVRAFVSSRSNGIIMYSAYQAATKKTSRILH